MTLMKIFFKLLLPVSGLTMFSWVQPKHSLKKPMTNFHSPRVFYYPVKTMSLQLCR